MSVSRILIFGEPLAGKEVLLKYVRHAFPDLPLKELDDEMVWANGGSWPQGTEYRTDNLVPYIWEQVMSDSDIVFLASYIPADEVVRAKHNGFSVYVLEISRAAFMHRDHSRFSRTHHTEMSSWVAGHPDFIQDLEHAGLIDGYIDGEMTPDNIISEIMAIRDKNLSQTNR